MNGRCVGSPSDTRPLASLVPDIQVRMDPADVITKTSGAVNGLLDIVKKGWFVALLLWALLIVELSMLWTGTTAIDVLQGTLVDTLRMTFLAPGLDWIAIVLEAAAENPVVWTIGYLVVTVLAVVSIVAFWRDGSELNRDSGADIAPTNIMLRFVILSTFASFSGSLSTLFIAGGVAAAAYALAAAVKAPRHQRPVTIAAALMFFVVFSLGGTLLCPAILLTVALWRALL